ncbi:unnamed protein product [Rotaria sp. Silwood2]|nr:unnamed protein product [Rotaria sp. Silwood2]CAF2794641.1 unnamed protein product [Rotaria sp. Silwood2]CAF3159226.1 unnamed protein product [Rotaria sp. Silwood2]CAF4036589.1 unnamed protein product [Rotaria sp. Silwood2]CAF4137871.1 unnamed protein product [Rotaria sp. Silwood2]
MHSSKENLCINDQLGLDKQDNRPDIDSPTRSYAIIETNPNELDHIIDLLRQFFPKTKVIEYSNQNHSPNPTIPQQQQQISFESICNSPFSILSKSSFDSDINNDQLSSNTSPQTFKGKVKDYLQRRYLEQVREHESPKETLTKFPNENTNSLDISSNSNVNKPLITLKSHSFDSSSIVTEQPIAGNLIQTNSPSFLHSQSKRGLLQRSTNIDMDDTSNATGNIIFTIDQHDDDDDDNDKSCVFRHSYSESQTNDNNNHWFIPCYHAGEQEKDKRTSSFSSRISLPHMPHLASSDPGPFHSPWFNTSTFSYEFRFPECQEQLAANSEGSIAQLSTLTNTLCDESTDFALVSPGCKTEKHDVITSKDLSSILSCQICGQEFVSRQMYLTHCRTHLKNSSQDDLSDILDFDPNYDRSSNSRDFSCKICSKHFARSDMLNRHLRLHAGTRPYRCVICNAYFSRSDHLSTHFRTHTGEKPYTCSQCSYSACRRDMITRHLKIHTKQRPERKRSTTTIASNGDSSK